MDIACELGLWLGLRLIHFLEECVDEGLLAYFCQRILKENIQK